MLLVQYAAEKLPVPENHFALRHVDSVLKFTSAAFPRTAFHRLPILDANLGGRFHVDERLSFGSDV